ncbi:hypothetical protein CUMW_249440 [Citrus unshiu]|uniref:Amidase domain-containing protein n=1 Tax=Citrus unshiu TaxID=55188 RepID=A0A2H5QPH8_CITUN|nr:hypothetical protein CUMW_249440 [Citrus unshiu]
MFCLAMATNNSSFKFSLFSHLVLNLLILLATSTKTANSYAFSIKEATIEGIQLAFRQNQLASRQLVQFYIGEIRRLNPVLNAVIEVNPDALLTAGLHGILFFLRDNIATKDKMNTTAGMLCSAQSCPGCLISKAPSGFSGRGGQGKNPYVLSADPCGSSSGSAISVAANLAAVSLGTETDGSILCPSSSNSVVGLKPTLGLTSRAGVIPITPRQDSVGPICRTVADAAYVLDAIAGFDHYDPATRAASEYIPRGGYKQFLRPHGLKGKRLGIVRNPFFNFDEGSPLAQVFDHHLHTLRQEGALVIDHLEIGNINSLNSIANDETTAMLAEFKLAINAYLKELVTSPVRSLAEVIAFNNKFSDLEKIKEYGQDLLLSAEATDGIGKTEKAAILNLERFTRDGFEKLMSTNNLDALVTPRSYASTLLAVGGFPGINVPAGYDSEGYRAKAY